jgi:putrescine importer
MSVVEQQPVGSKAAKSGGTLKRNSLGLLGVGTLGAVMLSPALGLYGNFAAMETTAGPISAFIFILGLVIALPSAISYAMVSRELPAAGSAYTWLWRATRPALGAWVGWIMATYYVIVMFLQPIIFGLFFNELLAWFGISAGKLSYVIGVLLATAIVIPAVYRDVQVSARTALILMVFEMITVLALSVTILVVLGGKGHVSAAPFNPGNATGGFSAISTAALFGILAFTGFDAASTVAEEAKTPKSLVPVATIISVLVVGAFWIFTSWAFSLSTPASHVAALANQGVTPITPIAGHYWHRGDVVVTITGLTASLGCYIAGMVAIGRVLFAMGRDDVMPGLFGRLHRRYGTPWYVLHMAFLLVIVICVVVAAIAGPFKVWIWCGSATVFFALVTYAFVHIGNISYYWRYKRASFNWFWSGLIPAIGLGVIGYALYKSFFKGLWNSGFAMGQSIVLFAIIWSVLGAIYTLYLVRFRGSVLRRESSMLGSTGAPVDSETTPLAPETS